MKWFRVALVGFAFLIGTTGGMAQQLWQAASYGMSVPQVKAAFPSAIELDPSPGKTLRSGAVGLLEIKDVQIVGRPFAAVFFFLGGLLTQVSLSHDGDPSSALNTFNELTAALRSKYGAEILRKTDMNRTYGFSGRSVWSQGRTSIQLYGAFGNINIAYSVKLAEDADKL